MIYLMILSLILGLGSGGLSQYLARYLVRSKSKHKLSVFLFLTVEALSCLFYVWMCHASFTWPQIISSLLVFHLLVIASLTDLYEWIIPNRLLAVFIAGSIFLLPTFTWFDFLIRFLGLSFGFMLPFLVSLFSRGGIGGGDIKLFMVLGWLVGLPTLLLGMAFSCLLGLSFFGLYSLVLNQASKKPNKLPFAPFILGGFLIILLRNGTF